MEVLKRGKTKDGVKMQIENWNDDYPTVYSEASSLGLYPNTIRDPKDTVRIWLQFKSKEEALEAYEDLEAGRKRPQDYREALRPGVNPVTTSYKDIMEYMAQ